MDALPIFTTSQAAAITGLSRKAVQDAINRRLVPTRSVRRGRATRRYLSQEALVCLHLESQGLAVFPAAIRKRLFDEIMRTPDKMLVRPSAIITVDLQPSRQAVSEAVRLLKVAESMVSEDAEVLSGTPVFRGTRVPVHQIALELQCGATVEEVIESYPSVTRHQVEIATLYALAHPVGESAPRRHSPGSLPAKVVSFKLPGLGSWRKSKPARCGS